MWFRKKSSDKDPDSVRTSFSAGEKIRLNLRCSKLSSLTLDNPHFHNIPLENVVSIDLSYNTLSELSPDIFQHLPRLEMIRLFGNRLEALPGAEIAKIPTLTTVEAGKNALTELPPEMCHCPTLRELDLNWNKIPVLPDKINELSRLKLLCLSVNHLTTVPPTLSSLTLLENLDLSSNCFRDFPLALCELPVLTHLNLCGNALTTVPEEIGKLKKLLRLDIRSNHLTSLSSGIGGLTSLRWLFVSNNMIETLPEEISECSMLKELDASGNTLVAIPASIGSCVNLQKLHLWNNRLTALPLGIKYLQQLQDLDLANNSISSLPDEFNTLSVYTLNLAHNAFSCLPPLPPTIQEINFVHNNLTILEGISALTNLQTALFTKNNLSGLPPCISSLSNLRFLDCAHNALTSVPDSLENPELTSLNLSFNNIDHLGDDFFQHLAKLRILYLAHNNLNTLPSSLHTCTMLKEFNINGNKFEVIPHVIEQFPALKIFSAALNLLTAFPNPAVPLSVESLSLACNTITSVDNSSLAQFPRLKELDLSHNALFYSEIEEEDPSQLLENLQKSSPTPLLEDVNLCSNHLEASYFFFTEALDLHNCQIAHNAFNNLPMFHHREDRKCRPTIRFEGNRELDRCSFRDPEIWDSLWEESPVLDVRMGYADTKGRRPEMQDSLCFLNSMNGCPHIHFGAIFDGHSGTSSSTFCGNYFHTLLIHLLISRELHSNLGRLEEFISEVYKLCFENCQSQIVQRQQTDGTTALCALFIHDHLYVACCGDSRIVGLTASGSSIALSRDHKPNDVDEKNRIAKLGGFVTPSGRTNGELAVSRSLGDISLHPFVSHEPEITCFDVRELNLEFVILACDGVWDVFSNQEAADIVAGVFRCQKESGVPLDPFVAALKLRDAAFFFNSGDNISVGVILV